MTRFEMLLFSRELMMKINNAGINIRDAKYIKLYEEYQIMRKNSEKKTYICEVLAVKHHVCVRTIYNVIKHFEKHCKSDAV